MASTLQEPAMPEPNAPAPVADPERIVISGMSGLFPSSHSIKELEEILYNKVNPVTKDVRWSYNHPEVARHAGIVPDVERFDAQFFKTHYRLTKMMDPMSRKILEHSYHAIYDAGVNPEQLSGKKIGVFVGISFSETEKIGGCDAVSANGFGITGSSRSMFANRISYCLNAKGPSLAIDAACCSSTTALEQAYLAMNRGDCEGAIVCGSYLCLHPHSSVYYRRMMKQSKDGKTKSFDESADGCVKSEAINVLFLQKAKDALRIYADVMHVKTEFTGLLHGETGLQYGFLRNPGSVVNFLNKFYEEARVPPNAVEYVEAFGSAVPEADKIELEVIDKVFCKDKEDTLLVGSVTSNIGYTEAASGICAIAKVLIGFQRGEIASNLHCSKPRQDVAALREGRMRVVDEHQRFRRTYVAVNGMSLTGVNSHVLLNGHYKPKDLSRYQTNIPRLVTISARQESAVQKIFVNLKSHAIDPEELALLHNIHQTSVAGHLGRGFIILQTNEEQKTVSLCEKAEYFDDAPRPLWFVYSGMGSQWAGMGAQLMRIPIFAAAIERCRQVLEPKGIDIVHIITSPDKAIFDNILHSFVGITAVQIGLTDVLRELGLVPDGIIGHSVGELGCAYADGCLTAEETILSAYSRGLVSLQTPFIRGSMAAVGMGYEQISKLCPPEIEVACHNGPESSTISGPADVMKEFVAELTAKEIFAKEIPCSNIAFHSRYIADAGPGLLKYLKEVIKTPRPRSGKWVSTSIPEEKWDSPLAQTSSAEYHTNNLLNPVLFEETLKHIPNNAVLVEVAPHGLLQAILKRSLPADCRNIALTRRGHPDNTYLVLEAIGKLYMEGYNPKVQVLYPKVEMPVSTGTPYLSHLIEWAHGEKWPVLTYRAASRRTAAACTYTLSYYDKENMYLQGNVIREKILFPFAATLVSVWDALAMIQDVPKKQLSVEFSDVHLYVQPVMNSQAQLKLRVTVQRGVRSFEVLDENILIAKGKINAWKCKDPKYNLEFQEYQDMTLNAADIYDLLRERDYMYSGEFRSIECANGSLSRASVQWRENWVTLIDGMLQLNVLRQPYDGVIVPTYIRRICIDVKEHEARKRIVSEDKVTLDVDISETYDLTRCGGVLLENIRYRSLPAVSNSNMALQTLKFIPHFKGDQQDVTTSLKIYLQMVAENINQDSIKVIGITNDKTRGSVFDEMKNIGSNVYRVKIDYNEYNQEDLSSIRNQNQLLLDVDLVLVRNLSKDDNVCQLLHNVVNKNIFIVSEEDRLNGERSRPTTLYRVVASHSDARSRVDLVRWRPSPAAVPTTAVTVRSRADLALLNSARTNLPARQRLLIIATYPAPSELKDLVSAWRKDAERNLVHLITVNNEQDNNFFLDDLPDVDLAFTVLDHGKWGGEYYIPMKNSVKVSSNVKLQIEQVGDFNSLKWIEAPKMSGSGIQVTVHYAGLSNTDIKKANGIISFKDDSENSYGMDFSGITESGQRVMGLIQTGAMSSEVRARPELLWPVPAHWSLEDAATVPLAYVHAFYCLVVKSNLQPAMRVMVHGGAGALGQATIALALAYGCEVFTTVSDIRKKQFLLKLFPKLKAENVGSSRDHSFGDMVLTATKGNGCEIVLSSVRGAFKNTSVNCTGFLGVCLDVSQLHSRDEDFNYRMFGLTKERQYAAIDFSTIFETASAEDVKVLHRLMSEGINLGYVRPLSRVTYAPHDAVRAFRLLAASRHRGRVLLRMREQTTPVQPRLSCNPNYCHLILMDEEMFGLQLVERLVTRGARKIHIHHNTLSTAKLQFKLRSWQKIGVQVETSSDNLVTENNMVKLFNDAGHLGSIQGVYAVTNGNQVQETLFANLDSVSRRFGTNLRYFAVINVGETMFGQQTCHSRVQNKLPATMITLPVINHFRDALDATERALCGDEFVLVALTAPTQRPDLLKQLSTLTGVCISKDTPLTITLEELGIQNDKMQSIAAFLRVHYNIEYTEAEIPLLTLETLQNVEKPEKAVDESVSGLESFISYVDSDELRATVELILMPTLTSGDVCDDECNVTEKYLCIVPGIEGHHERFRMLCERLKLPALVLQPGHDHPQETVRETAERFVQILRTKAAIKNNFYFLGYETGVLVAMEMAAILEDTGLIGTVYCLGCEPDEVQAVIERSFSSYKTEEDLQNHVIKHMFKLMVGDVTEDLEMALSNTASWSQKVDACLRSLLGRVPHSAQYARALLDTPMLRIERARTYVPRARTLRSQLVLLRSASPQAMSAPLALQQHSQKPVAVHQLSTPLTYATSDIRCASIINKYLDSETLEEFESKNICDVYIFNTFWDTKRLS